VLDELYLPEPVIEQGVWRTLFQREAASFLVNAFPDAKVTSREDLIGKPIQIQWKGWSDIIDEGDWKAVAFHLMDMVRRAR
jgi:hypothetical protein